MQELTGYSAKVDKWKLQVLAHEYNTTVQMRIALDTDDNALLNVGPKFRAWDKNR
jgi:hypothetical protein